MRNLRDGFHRLGFQWDGPGLRHPPRLQIAWDGLTAMLRAVRPHSRVLVGHISSASDRQLPRRLHHKHYLQSSEAAIRQRSLQVPAHLTYPPLLLEHTWHGDPQYGAVLRSDQPLRQRTGRDLQQSTHDRQVDIELPTRLSGCQHDRLGVVSQLRAMRNRM